MNLKLFLMVVFFMNLQGPLAGANEEGGEGGAAKSSAEEVSPEEREFTEKTAKLSGLEAKIEELDKALDSLIAEKKHEKNPEKMRLLLKDLVSKTRERNAAVDEHRQLKSYLLYRFPGKGKVIQGKYRDHEKASVDTLEKAGGLKELLRETKTLIDEKYRSFDPKTPEAEEAPVEPEKKKEKTLKLVR
jgi:hypothetical protein